MLALPPHSRTLGKLYTHFLICKTGLQKCLPNKTQGVKDETQLLGQSKPTHVFLFSFFELGNTEI